VLHDHFFSIHQEAPGSETQHTETQKGSTPITHAREPMK